MTGGLGTGGRRYGIWTAGLAVAALLGVGCDTVAEISFTQRELRGAATNGTINASACTDSDVTVRFTFSIFDGDEVLIAPGEVINDEQLVIEGAGANFSTEDVTFVDSFLYPSPDQPCTGDEQCTAPFSCVPINPFNPGNSSLVCGMPIAVETLQTPLTFDDGEDEKTIAILMDHSATLLGLDADGNFESACTTDRTDQRLSGVRAFLLNYRGSSFAEDTAMCVVSLAGEGVGGVFFDPTQQTCLTDLSDGADELDARLGSMGVGEGGELQSALTPIWSAITETINLQLADAPGDRIIILFTDGPDDGSVLEDFNAARNAALDNGVVVHVVHLDNPPAGADCLVVPSAPGDLDLFAQLACETGGSYQYAEGPSALRALFGNLASTVGANYEIEAQVLSLADQGLPADIDVYRIATGVEFNVANGSIRIQLAGDKTDTSTAQLIDDRLTVFVRPVPPPPEGSGS